MRKGRGFILSRLVIIFLIIPLFFFPACQKETRVAEEGKAPKILVYYDFEGISNVCTTEQVLFGEARYQEARELLTEDVNAAIRGLIRGGAGEIVVTDAHGSGNPEPDILLDKMDKRAVLELRDEPFEPYIDSPNSTYQGIVAVGMHSYAGSPGVLSHTYTVHTMLKVNEIEFNESDIIALSATRFDVPLIMVSGDDVLEKQIKNLHPQTEYALVKTAKGKTDADFLPYEEALQQIEEAAYNAMKRIDEIPPFTLDPPYKMEFSFQTKSQTDIAANYPGLTRIDNCTLGLESNDFVEGYQVWIKLISLSALDNLRFFLSTMRGKEYFQEVVTEGRKAMLERWVAPGFFRDERKPVEKEKVERKYQGVQ